MPIANQWKGVGLTHVGLVRPTNQDTLLIDNTLGLWVVADGMGGHAGGDVASQLAIDTIHQYIAEQSQLKTKTKAEDWQAILKSAVVQANATLRQRAKVEPTLKGMGTTVVFMLKPNTPSQEAFIVHVGDSRAYRIRDHQISALTRDHTLLEERIQVGLLPRTTSSSHPLGHVLTQGIGVESTVAADVSKIELQETDEFLLCSDGLIKMMSDDQILEILQKNPTQTAQEKCQALVDHANELGGNDNTTVLLIQAE